ncbi:Serrate RNA effector molecule [Hibiscus syriacus]|uniref:Serrate RNA effector molecule n=1 Tax=Hibiscus syriacus TaxID=106335 RepID=A0A6A3CZT9_HIBSY|nr:Serrate RNA effector molecule [Hibiscus syriacus]
MPVDSIDSRRGGDRKDDNNNNNDNTRLPASDDPNSSPPAPQPSRRRDRDSRERRDRDFYDHDRSPLPPTPRERDYKRRSSISPPPPPLNYRDRRHSPPPYKRYRREDGGYGWRRGSPRGGFGPGDRRFGHDYGGGYDRDMMGRPGFPDDRPHGRYFGCSSGGYQDWDSGRGRYGDASNTGSAQREGLMSYKQFIQELEDDILPGEAERRYQDYKSEYISTQKRAFFDAHKDEEWLREKYHPTNLVTVIERRNELARKVAKDFLLDLQSGTLDLSPVVNAFSSNKSRQTSEPISEDETDIGGKRRRHGKGPAKETDLSLAPSAHPISSDSRRIQIDIRQAQDLVRRLDSDKGIEENILSGSDNDKINRDKSHGSLTGPVIIVRGLTSVKGLEAKGLRHVRAEGKSSDVTSNGFEWEKKLDSHWQERLRGQDPLEIMTAEEKIDAAAVEALDPFVRKIRDEKYGWKYGCGAKGCTKLFHAAEFVHKHLKLKHLKLVIELTSKVREELYFQNYMNDPDAPGGTPVMQPFLTDKPQRRKLMENRLKDERESRRERDRANGSDRFDRFENPQSSDFPSNNDGPGGGSNDDPMFDAFGVKGMHVAAPLSSDIAPPPVLMPVPGAGPLGPFVPAPPELAMQVFREQGGGGPFEGNNISGRGGPNLSEPAPILLPPGFRQDPRRYEGKFA